MLSYHKWDRDTNKTPKNANIYINIKFYRIGMGRPDLVKDTISLGPTGFFMQQ